MRRFIAAPMVALIVIIAALALEGCGVRQLPTAATPETPASYDTTRTIRDTCTTIITESQTFDLRRFTLGTPGTKQPLFEGTRLCDRMSLVFITRFDYVGADNNTPPPLSIWIKDVDDRYTAIPATWNQTSRTSLQLPNISGTYVDTAYVRIDRSDFPTSTAVTAYVLWGAAGAPTNAQPTTAGPATPNAVLWHYEGSGVVTKTCLADSCWTDTTVTITRRP